MKKTKNEHLLPVIVVGKSLQQMYNESEPGRKKIVAIKAGIEDSNMRASLNPTKNISKQTLQKMATGLDVCPVIFYLSKSLIDKEFLEQENNIGVTYIKDFDHLMQIINIPEETDELIESINKEVLNILEDLKAKIHLLETTKLHRRVNKKSVIEIILDLSALIRHNE
jgi:hypothetical protein